jgi:uncharacterized protein YraI
MTHLFQKKGHWYHQKLLIDPFFSPPPTTLLVTIDPVKKRIWINVWASAVLLAGCSSGDGAVNTPTFITATLPALNTPLPASTQIPSPTAEAAPTAVLAPVEGVTTTQLNLRSEPSTAGESVGTVAAFSTIQIIGRESFGKWVQILEPASAVGNGWIISSYVQVTGSGEIPIVDLGPRGLVLQGVNVRTGPGRDQTSLGTLVANDVIGLTGKDSSGDWLQVNFKGSAGWVSSEFLQVEQAESLPILGGQGNAPQPAETTAALPLSMEDHDTLQTPINSVVLSPSGTGGLQSNGFVSHPLDEADWIQFTAQNTQVSIQVKCAPDQASLDLYITGSLAVEDFLKCNETKILSMQPGQPYTLKLHANAEVFIPLPYSVLINIVK